MIFVPPNCIVFGLGFMENVQREMIFSSQNTPTFPITTASATYG